MTAVGGDLLHWRSRDGLHRLQSYQHGKMLARQARKELASAKRLAALNAGFSLTNDGWIILLQVLVNALSKQDTTVAHLAVSLDMNLEILSRYLRVLEREKLVVCAKGINPEGTISIGDEGLVRLARYFLPQAANE